MNAQGTQSQTAGWQSRQAFSGCNSKNSQCCGVHVGSKIMHSEQLAVFPIAGHVTYSTFTMRGWKREQHPGIRQKYGPIRSMALLEGLPSLIKLPSSMPSMTPKIVADNRGSCITMAFNFFGTDLCDEGSCCCWCCVLSCGHVKYKEAGTYPVLTAAAVLRVAYSALPGLVVHWRALFERALC